MCGFNGLFNSNGLSDIEKNTVKLISQNMSHRGPDQSGLWTSGDNKVIFCHRRLSINDLSDEGRQPMLSKCERYILLFNGEIYNFKKNKIELEKSGYKFRGKSDTEVLLALIDKKGLFDALNQINGMYSVAVIDKKLNKIFLARDLTGQKPLYYYYKDGKFYFSSELRNIFKLFPNLKLSQTALNYFFQLSYIPSPWTIYENVFKLEKGICLTFDLTNNKFEKLTLKKKKKFNDLKLFKLSEKVDKFDQVFSEVMEDHLVSDVNIGSLLSGGIDSSIVSLYAAKVSVKKINSYCVKSNSLDFDESSYASIIANQIGTDHHTLEFTNDDILNTILNIHNIYDEPFADSSQIPTTLLFNTIKNQVKVTLSGDGGDEMFCGYNRHLFVNRYYKTLSSINFNLRNFISKFLKLFTEKNYDYLNNVLKLNYFNLGNKIYKTSNALKFKNLEEFYFQIIRQDCNEENIVKNFSNSKNNFLENIKFSNEKSFTKNFQDYDRKYYLPDDIFVKVDRASMSNSIECRAPFVDERVIDFSDNLNEIDKIRNNEKKFFLKKILERNIKKKYFNRPKMGFGNPIDRWLNNELKSWADNLIRNNNDFLDPYINIELINKMWLKHQSGKYNYSTVLWNFLMLKKWMENNEYN